ncbi:MAG: hypothetical protein NT004_01345 [Bacteroidetes bacterium]|nr:hypothetical protein [Bacteroidota bacterium]
MIKRTLLFFIIYLSVGFLADNFAQSNIGYVVSVIPLLDPNDKIRNLSEELRGSFLEKKTEKNVPFFTPDRIVDQNFKKGLNHWPNIDYFLSSTIERVNEKYVKLHFYFIKKAPYTQYPTSAFIKYIRLSDGPSKEDIHEIVDQVTSEIQFIVKNGKTKGVLEVRDFEKAQNQSEQEPSEFSKWLTNQLCRHQKLNKSFSVYYFNKDYMNIKDCDDILYGRYLNVMSNTCDVVIKITYDNTIIGGMKYTINRDNYDQENNAAIIEKIADKILNKK